MREPLLNVEAVESGYDITQVLFGLSLMVWDGEIVSLSGRNGMGKTTTIRMIMGLLPVWAGQITFSGHVISSRQPHVVARLGIGLVPEGRQVFPSLTVRENLLATSRPGRGDAAGWGLADVLDVFPRLRERLDQGAGSLSGGEQQMLAIGRALMTNPKLLILDEATEGLAPLMRAEIWSVLGRLKAQKQAVLLIDKNLDALSRLVDRCYVIERGRIAWTGEGSELLKNRDNVERFLTV